MSLSFIYLNTHDIRFFINKLKYQSSGDSLVITDEIGLMLIKNLLNLLLMNLILSFFIKIRPRMTNYPVGLFTNLFLIFKEC